MMRSALRAAYGLALLALGSPGLAQTPPARPASPQPHGPGPGMVVTCTSGVSVPSDAPATTGPGVTIRNAATNAFEVLPLRPTASAPEVCATILKAAQQAGLRAHPESADSVAIYGTRNLVSVTFATIAERDF